MEELSKPDGMPHYVLLPNTIWEVAQQRAHEDGMPITLALIDAAHLYYGLSILEKDTSSIGYSQDPKQLINQEKARQIAREFCRQGGKLLIPNASNPPYTLELNLDSLCNLTPREIAAMCGYPNQKKA